MRPQLTPKLQTTLSRVFAHPVPQDIPLPHVLALVEALGAVVVQKKSGVGVKLGSGALNTHWPPTKRRLMDKGQVAHFQRLLEAQGFTPDTCA